MKKGKLIIISAPSGTGKSTIIGQIINDPDLKLEFSISATTRPPRTGEIDGVHYHFLTVEQFKEAIANDALVEYEEVYEGVNVKKMYGDNALSIFIQPPSIEVLRERLISRATDPIEAINQRVDKAAYELTFKDRFDVSVVNDDLNTAVQQTRSLINDFVN